MKLLYPFEDEGPEPLAYLPLCVRYRLDLAGLHLSLKAWQALPLSERQALCAVALDRNCNLSQWEGALLTALLAASLDPPGNCPAIRAEEFGVDKIPTFVASPLQSSSSEPSPSETRDAEGAHRERTTLTRWQNLAEIDRYALWKTAQSKRGTKLFKEAAEYFGFSAF